jgi:hypothetical protein
MCRRERPKKHFGCRSRLPRLVTPFALKFWLQPRAPYLLSESALNRLRRSGCLEALEIVGKFGQSWAGAGQMGIPRTTCGRHSYNEKSFTMGFHRHSRLFDKGAKTQVCFSHVIGKGRVSAPASIGKPCGAITHEGSPWYWFLADSAVVRLLLLIKAATMWPSSIAWRSCREDKTHICFDDIACEQLCLFVRSCSCRICVATAVDVGIEQAGLVS